MSGVLLTLEVAGANTFVTGLPYFSGATVQLTAAVTTDQMYLEPDHRAFVRITRTNKGILVQVVNKKNRVVARQRFEVKSGLRHFSFDPWDYLIPLDDIRGAQ